MASLPLTVAILGLVVCALYLLRNGRSRLPAGAKRLPGPKSLPLIGRVHDVPPEQSWLKFHEWSKEFGPIYQHEMFGSVHVWISSEKIAHELLSRRAAIYSDRPQIPNLPDNRTSGDYLALSGRNDTWRRQRRLCAQLMAVSANASLHDYPTQERDRFVYLMWKDPSQYREWVEQFTARTVSRLSWGSAHPSSVLRETTFGLLETISPSGALPNVISWLMHVPLFMSPWKKKEAARHAREAVLLKGNVKWVHDRLEQGNAEPSFVRTYIDNLIRNDKDAVENGGTGSKWGPEAEATYVVGQMAIAGALTIGSPIQSFILAMLHFPDWQRKLQAEIDSVYGVDGGPPQWVDREKLPVLRACVKEVIRWRPPVPTGIPHAIEKDDIYEGYFIPAGATIHALEWAITRDEETYPDPEAFNPGRWLDPAYPTYKEPLTQFPNLAGFSQFGFGRRTCQGVPIVDQDLFLAMGGMAWAFQIVKKKLPDGTEAPVHWNDYTPLLIAKPAPFVFDLHTRGPDTAAREAQFQAMWEGSRDEQDLADEERERLGRKIGAMNRDGGSGEAKTRQTEFASAPAMNCSEVPSTYPYPDEKNNSTATTVTMQRVPGAYVVDSSSMRGTAKARAALAAAAEEESSDHGSETSTTSSAKTTGTSTSSSAGGLRCVGGGGSGISSADEGSLQKPPQHYHEYIYSA